MTHGTLKPLYYVKGDWVHKRPVCTKRADGMTNHTLGFPVCKASEYISAETVCGFFNEHDRPSASEPTP